MLPPKPLRRHPHPFGPHLRLPPVAHSRRQIGPHLRSKECLYLCPRDPVQGHGQTKFRPKSEIQNAPLVSCLSRSSGSHPANHLPRPPKNNPPAWTPPRGQRRDERGRCRRRTKIRSRWCLCQQSRRPFCVQLRQPDRCSSGNSSKSEEIRPPLWRLVR